MTRTLEIEKVDVNNQTLKKNIPYANPSASDADLVTFAQKLVGLTTNTLITAKKIDTSTLI